MNRFAFSLTLSLLCCTTGISASQAQQAFAVSHPLPQDTLEQMAEEQDLPIALLEDNQAFVQEEPSERQINTQTETSTNVNDAPSLPTPVEIPSNASHHEVVPEENVPEASAQQEVTENDTREVKAYPVPQASVPYSEPLSEPEPSMEVVSENPPQETPAEHPIISQENSVEASSDIKTAPVVIPLEKAAPAADPTPPTEVLNSEATTQETVSEQMPDSSTAPAPSSFRSSAFSLNEKAPIPAKLFGDNGFAPSMMDKKISISPEQRAQMMMKKKYDEMDFNRDGVVSENEFIHYKTEEARKISRQIFQHVDINKDGIISESEYEVLMKKMIDSFMKQPSAMSGAPI